MFDLPRFYISACSNSVQYVRLHPIMMSILLYHHKQLSKCISDVEQIETRVNRNYGRRRLLTVNEEEKEKEEEKPKSLNQAIHSEVVVAAVPIQENNGKTAAINRKRKFQTSVKKEEHSLDSYFINNKSAES